MPMSSNDRAVLQVLQAYEAAVFQKDVDAFAALYAPDMRAFDLWGQWAHEGIAAWRAMAADWFGSLGTDRVVVRFSEVQSMVTPNMALVQAFVSYSAIDPQGSVLRALTNRMTVVLRPQAGAGAWKIVHQHTSAPVDHQTGKPVLQR
jgi:uncharacterized protein (TIGR02246 family)